MAKRLLAFFLLLGIYVECALTSQPIRIGLRHIENKGVGYNTGYTTLEGFFAVNGDKYVPFFDVRGHVFDNGKWAANAGMGFRALWDCRTYGINVYYDWRHSHKNWQQIGAGLEFLGNVWDFRANGYFPFGERTKVFGSPKFLYFSNHYAYVCRKGEFSMTGVDAEFGGHINSIDWCDFYIGAGPYYFAGRDGGDNAIGGKVRILGRITDYFTAQLSGSYDAVFHGIVQGEIGLTIPLGPRKRECCTTCCDYPRVRERIVQPVYRDEIIVLDKHCKKDPAINPATGEPYFFWFVNNTSSSLGTFESPFPRLVLAQNASSANDVIYVFPGDGTTNGMDAGINLKDGQYLLGSSVVQPLATSAGTLFIPAQSSVMPTIANLSNDCVLLRNNNTVSGLHIDQPDFNNISGIGIANVSITNNILTNSGGGGAIAGISLGKSSPLPASIAGNVYIAGNIITSPSDTFGGVEIFPQNNEVCTTLITSNLIITRQDAMKIETFDTSHLYLTVQNNTLISNNSHRGFDLEPHSFSFISFDIHANQIQGIGDIGLDIVARDASTCTGSVLSNVFSNSHHGFTFEAGGSGYFMNVSASNNTFTNNTLTDFVADIPAGRTNGKVCVGLQNNNAPSHGYEFTNDEPTSTININTLINNIGDVTASGAGPITNLPGCP